MTSDLAMIPSNLTPKAKVTKAATDKFTKRKASAQKGSRQQKEGQRRGRGGTAGHVSDKGPACNKSKEAHNSTAKNNLKIQLKNGQKSLSKLMTEPGRCGSVVERGPKNQEVAGEGAENWLSPAGKGGAIKSGLTSGPRGLCPQSVRGDLCPNVPRLPLQGPNALDLGRGGREVGAEEGPAPVLSGRSQAPSTPGTSPPKTSFGEGAAVWGGAARARELCNQRAPRLQPPPPDQGGAASGLCSG